MPLSWETETRIFDLLAERKRLRYTEVAHILRKSASTGYNVCQQLALKYPDNLAYDLGFLRLTKPLDISQVSREQLLQRFLQLQREVHAYQKRDQIIMRFMAKASHDIVDCVLRHDLERLEFTLKLAYNQLHLSLGGDPEKMPFPEVGGVE